MPAGKPTSFRPTAELSEMLGDLESHFGVKRTAVIGIAVRALHRKEIGQIAKRSKVKKTAKKS